MSVRVSKDGQLVHLHLGTQMVGTREVEVSASRVCYAGQVFADDKVTSAILDIAKNGDGRKFTYVDDDDDQPPESEAVEEGSKDDFYDPSKHNQDEVLEYLETADATEVGRVKTAEAAGMNRAKIRGFEPKAS